MTYLWLISQFENRGWDTYDSAVVVAPDEDAAKETYPGILEWNSSDWASGPDRVKAIRLGIADDPTPRVVCASFNAG